MYSRKYIKNRCLGKFKSIQKSVRFNSLVYEYIEAFEGKNFSDKLENIIIEYANHNDKM